MSSFFVHHFLPQQSKSVIDSGPRGLFVLSCDAFYSLFYTNLISVILEE